VRDLWVTVDQASLRGPHDWSRDLSKEPAVFFPRFKAAAMLEGEHISLLRDE
jgi:hypothetical protein